MMEELLKEFQKTCGERLNIGVSWDRLGGWAAFRRDTNEGDCTSADRNANSALCFLILDAMEAKGYMWTMTRFKEGDGPELNYGIQVYRNLKEVRSAKSNFGATRTEAVIRAALSASRAAEEES